MTATTRRPATAADMVKGAIVYKGQGKTAWRVWGVGEASASVVKATTEADPTRGCWYRFEEFTVEVVEEIPAAKVTVAAEVARPEVTVAVGRPTAADLGINPTGERFYAARADGRYRVIDGDVIDARQDGDAPGTAYVATCASRAKAEERAAALNAEAAASTPRTVEDPRVTTDPAERAVLLAAAARLDALPTDDEPTPAEATLTTWVGWSIVELVAPRLDDADPAVAAVARKLADRTPDKANARTIRMTAAEVAALSAVATEIETDATTRGAGALARSARALRGRLA